MTNMDDTTTTAELEASGFRITDGPGLGELDCMGPEELADFIEGCARVTAEELAETPRLEAPGVLRRFARKVDMTGGPDACWPWKAGRSVVGYGQFDAGTKIGAHILAYEFATGEAPRGRVVRHACDVPHCVNPGHLTFGTHAENTADAIARGRRPGRSLTDAEVRALRATKQAIPALTHRELGDRYRTTAATVGQILRGKTRRGAAQ